MSDRGDDKSVKFRGPINYTLCLWTVPCYVPLLDCHTSVKCHIDGWCLILLDNTTSSERDHNESIMTAIPALRSLSCPRLVPLFDSGSVPVVSKKRIHLTAEINNLCCRFVLPVDVTCKELVSIISDRPGKVMHAYMCMVFCILKVKVT